MSEEESEVLVGWNRSGSGVGSALLVTSLSVASMHIYAYVLYLLSSLW